MPAALAALCAGLWIAAAPALAQPKERDEALEDEERQQAVARRVETHGEVCPDPAKPCGEFRQFRPHELSFRIGRKFDFDRGQDRSQPFYAVILRSGPLCGIAEAEREAAQSAFPDRKVFVHRHLCEDFTDPVTYTNVNRKAGFLAVYAGRTEAEARELQARVRAAGRYPDAGLRRMQVVLTYQLE